ncbi:hypothetical protein AOXY_G8578 [Acipenser oxyrinchus oxyrinchus]|uniref:Uncharacterized protein n=1 Tax=Acipenser oxyrinchus oxyrinchus TaxID=40147 RepID=A0AAD8DI44_ACIOX|nr:hypothetical protein AOXY_G8578 [Acipenser oxyrinchus oxyrinchus]
MSTALWGRRSESSRSSVPQIFFNNIHVGSNDDFQKLLFQWIFNHMGNSPKKKELDALLQAASYTVVYLPYDWSTNGKD